MADNNQPQDFFSAVLGQPTTQGAAPPQNDAPAVATTNTGSQGDFFSQVLGGGAPQQQQTDQTTQDSTGGDEGERMGEGESVFTRPLTTYLGIPEYRQGAGGVERGVEKFLSGLTSPLSLGLMLVTGGLGGLAEAGAATGAEELATATAPEALSFAGRAGSQILSKLAPETAASVAKAAGTIEKLANAGFTYQQIRDVIKVAPRIGDAIKAGDTDTAAEMITQAALGTVAAGLSTAHLLRGSSGEPVWSKEKEAIGAADQQRQTWGAQASQFADDHKQLIKDKPLDMAAMVYHEAGGVARDTGPLREGQVSTTQKLQQWRDTVANDKDIKPEVRDRWTGIIDQAMNLPDPLKHLSGELSGKYADVWKMYQDRNIVHDNAEGRADYAGPHVYDQENEGQSNVSDRRIRGRVQHLEKRTYDNVVDALQDGFEPTKGLAEAHVDYLRQVGQKMGHYEAEQALLTQRGEDGMPIAVSPAAVRNVKEVIPARGQSADLKTVGTKEGLPIMGLSQPELDRLPVDKIFQDEKGNYYLDVSGYKNGPDVFSRRRMIAMSDEGKPVTTNKPLLIHPDYIKQVNQAFADSSWFRNHPLFNALLKGSQAAKSSLLSLSPFHWTTEYLRGIQMGLDPLEAMRPDKLTPESAAVTDKFAPKLSMGSGERLAGRDDFAEGLASSHGIIGKIPGIGPALSAVEEKLFGPNGYIDRLKGATYDKVKAQISARHPNWSNDQVQFASGRMVDAAFGGLNYKMLGLSMNSVDAARLFMLAPDFTGSQVLFAKYGFEPGGSVIAKSLGRIGLYNFAAAQVLNLLVSGKVRLDHPFGVVSPDDQKTWSMRTMPQDILHGLTDPQGFAYNRLNPLITRTGWEALTGRDEQGKKADAEKQFHDLLRNVLPIPSQSFIPGFRREGEDILTGTLRGAGFTPLQNRTTAEQTARELASDRSPSGPVKPEQLERHQTVIDLENKLASKEIDMEAVDAALKAGKISRKDVTDIQKSLRETQLMGQADARLYRYASRLPVDDFLKVWAVATPPERRDLRPLLLKKFQAYTKEAVPSDPAYQQLRAIFSETTQTQGQTNQ